ncbi:DNA cytosine methyltransferase, partial [Enterococcus faecalis]
ERVFIIGHLRGERTRKVFPFKKNDRTFTKLQGQQIYANTLTTRIEAQGTGTYVIEREQHEEKIAIPVLTPDRLEKRQNGRRFKDDGEEMFTLTAQDRHGIMIAGNLPGNHDQNSRVYDSSGLAPTLSTMQGGGQEPKILAKEATTKGYSEATPGDVVTENFQIRKLTPRECWRLQGFPDWAFDKAKEVNSDSQLYKQAGNSVTVPVIADIASKLESE